MMDLCATDSTNCSFCAQKQLLVESFAHESILQTSYGIVCCLLSKSLVFFGQEVNGILLHGAGDLRSSDLFDGLVVCRIYACFKFLERPFCWIICVQGRRKCLSSRKSEKNFLSVVEG